MFVMHHFQDIIASVAHVTITVVQFDYGSYNNRPCTFGLYFLFVSKSILDNVCYNQVIGS